MPKLERPIDFGSLFGAPLILDDSLTPYEDLANGTLQIWNGLPPCEDHLHVTGSGKLISKHSPVAGITSYVTFNGERFTAEVFLGAGVFGSVAICLDPLGQPVVLKKMLARDKDGKSTAIIEVLSQCIVNRSEPSYTPAIKKVGRDGDDLFIIMEYRKGCDLKKFLGSQGSNDERRDTCQVALKALATMSRDLYEWYEFIHGDMKPDNLLRTEDGQVILIDFGFANMLLGPSPRHEIIARADAAKIRQPTRDLTMLLFQFRGLAEKQADVAVWLNDLLLPGSCNTEDPYLKGGIPAHPPHSLNSFRGREWAMMYRYMCGHNNSQASPQVVLEYAYPLGAPPLAPVAAAPMIMLPPTAGGGSHIRPQSFIRSSQSGGGGDPQSFIRSSQSGGSHIRPQSFIRSSQSGGGRHHRKSSAKKLARLLSYKNKNKNKNKKRRTQRRKTRKAC